MCPLPSFLKTESSRLVSRLFRDYGLKHARLYFIALILMATGAASTALTAWLLKPILNHMVEGSEFKELRQLSWMVVLLFTCRGLATGGSLIVLSRVGNRIVADVQTSLFNHLIQQKLSFFQDRHSSDFLTRLTLATNSIRDTLQIFITSVGRDFLTLMGLVSVMILQDGVMALIAFTLFPLAIFSLRHLVQKARRFSRRIFESSTQITQILQETIQGIRIVKSFNLEPVFRKRMQDAIGEAERAANRVQTSGALTTPLSDILAGFSIGAVIFYGSWRLTIAHGEIGSFFSFIAALLLAYEPAKRLAKVNLDIQNGFAAARMVYEILDNSDTESSASSPSSSPSPSLLPVQGHLVFNHVGFGYRPHDLVLHDIHLKAEPNQTTALVGPSGSGKSTLLALIQRFYDPHYGSITLDGHPLSSFPLKTLRETIAFVSQDVFLFQGTIRENIRFGRSQASQAEIEAAARQAHAHDFILDLPRGYETEVGEQGLQLSGGQRQRLALARAILKNAPILLLDEPTAALDSESEREIQKALDELRFGRTTLVVAHRLQTIVNADHICVIENGRTLENGTHKELIQSKGIYYSFFAAQFGL